MDLKKLSIVGVTADSREVQPNYAFVAVSGFADDGNKYIPQAVKGGATIVFTEKPPQEDYSVPIIQVPDARDKLAQLSAELAGNPGTQLGLIGVSGTNGKTSTTYLIHHILNWTEAKAGLLGTIDYKNGSQSLPAKLTTPDTTFLHQFLAQLVEGNNKVAVMEVSSHGIKLKRVKYLDFDIAIFTNLTPDHFDLHPDFQDYLQTKESWFTSLPSDACLLYNIDDPYWEEITAASKSNCKISLSMQNKGMICGENRHLNANGLEMDVVVRAHISGTGGKLGSFSIPPQRVPVKVKMLGEHNCYNVLSAVASCLAMGINAKTIQQSLAEFPGVWRRMQLLQQEPFVVIDDASHNPDNFQAVFQAVTNFSYQKLLVVVGIRGSRGWQINYENAKMIGSYCAQLDCKLIVTKSIDTNGAHDQVKDDEERAFIQGIWESGVELEEIDTLQDSLTTIVNQAQPGDLLLLLGAHPFDHVAQMVAPLLKERKVELDNQGQTYPAAFIEQERTSANGMRDITPPFRP